MKNLNGYLIYDGVDDMNESLKDGTVRNIVFIEKNIIDVLDNALISQIKSPRSYVIHVILYLFLRNSTMVEFFIEEADNYLIDLFEHNPSAYEACFTNARASKQAVQFRVTEDLDEEISKYNPNLLIIASLLYFKLI